MVKEEQQLGFLANVNPDELKLVEKKGRTGTPKQRKKALKAKRSEERGGGGGGGGGEPRLKEVEHVERKAFTKDWEKSLNMTASLPIKRQDGTVVKTMRPVEERDDEDEEEDEEEEAMEVETAQEEETVEPEEENEFDTIDIDELSNPKPKDKKVKELSLNQKKLHIADICNSVTSDPMETLRRQRTNEISTDDVHKLADLLRYLKDTDPRVQEVAMLSCLLVFKDICPSYRIRSREEYDKNVMLKKDTKKLRDYELALLASYQSYLKFLATTVATGLGSSKRDKPLTGEDDELKPAWELGLSALRCQCELTRFLLHFNMRTSLLESIVTRATQPLESVSAICCQTLKDVFTADTEGEVSFEIVGIMGKKLMSCKYNVPVAFLQTLDHVKLRVHADSARDIRRKAKQNRRKRKRQDDGADAALQETDVNTMAINTKRFQADALHEICIIYFRVIKMKVGYTLMPIVLENLGKITHLMNIDMVEDLCVLLKDMVQGTPPAPDNVKLLCIYCALKTLSGPGSELSIDDDSFIVGLRILLCDLPVDFNQWDVVFECIDMCLMKKRDVRNSLVLSFVRLLINLVPYLLPTVVGATALGLVHSILLRYPRARQSMEALSFVVAQRDDEVGDFAMQALKNESLDPESSAEGDGSWALPLLNLHIDEKYGRFLKTLTSKTIIPAPVRLSDARRQDPSTLLANIDRQFEYMPKRAKLSNEKTAMSKTQQFKKVGGGNLSKKQRNKLKKLQKSQQ